MALLQENSWQKMKHASIFRCIFSFWPKRARHPDSWQNVFFLKHDYFGNAYTYGFISCLFTGSL